MATNTGDWDAAEWDTRYRASELVWGAGPNRWVAEEVTGLAPGHAVDLACGEGRNALWLAELGWTVTAVDFSAVALDKGRAEAATLPHGAAIDWVLGDAINYDAPQSADLVLLCYFQLEAPLRRRAMRHAAAALRSGGVLLAIGHDSTNLRDGAGGPQDPARLFTAADLAGDLTTTDPDDPGDPPSVPLVIERADAVLRPVTGAERPAIDALLRARRS
jgi:SAM-dependent methyltransferase